MDLGGEQPQRHEIGSRTYVVAPLEPLDVDGVRTTSVGLVIWVIGFVALLPFHARLEQAGLGWLLWTCLAGVGLGLLGLGYCGRRRQLRRQAEVD